MQLVATLSMCVFASSVCAQATFAPGALIVGSRSFGTVLGPIHGPAGPNPLLSGQDLTSDMPTTRGTGIDLVSDHLSLLAMPGPLMFARPSRATNWGLYSIDLTTGNRTLLEGTNVALWSSGGDMIAEDADTILALADDWNAGNAGKGRLLRYTISTGETTLVSGAARGDGVVMYRPRSLARLDDTHVVVCEFGLGLNQVYLYSVDLVTGDRAVISTLKPTDGARFTVTGGVVSAARTTIPSRGTGPVVDTQIRGLAVLNGRLIVSGSLSAPYVGAIIEVDPLSGNRTLLGGTALEGGVRVTVPFGPGSTSVLFDAPTALQARTDHSLIMTATFGPNFVWEFDVNTRTLTTIADLGVQLATPFQNPQFTGLAIVPQSFCSGDFNHDGDSGTDQDIEAFFACLAGNCCPTCDTSDFNGDGDSGTDGDIEAFFRVLAGSPC